ncbi:amidohydrolase family protein [uncultured Sphingomonas sp.]|uniref:amidohydrolase family protein n=1 Tax=uncultured Sphingomonas sp. TaxID=158754 RepID=UPI0025F0A11C|nr:amidohydrolase family protein [uncultured Sphingomonas sp.]
MADSDTLPFIDAHVHFWDLAHLRYTWLTPPFSDDGPNGNVASIASHYGTDAYRAEAHRWNVVGMVHVEAGAAADQALAETDWLQQLNADAGAPDGIVAFAALDGLHVEASLAAQATRSRVRGIRQIVSWHPDPQHSYTPRDLTGDPAWRRGYAALARHDLSFDLQAYPAQLAALAPLIARHPDIPVFVNHAGMGVDGVGDWLTGLRALAPLPHVAIKISGLGFAVKPWDASAARDRIRAAIDLFGPERVMMASDFPTDRLFATFDETLATLHDAVADMVLGERQAMFAGNANRLYRLGINLSGGSQ